MYIPFSRISLLRNYLFNKQKELRKVEVVLVIAGLIGLALLIYLFYVLFRGEEL